MLKKKSPRDYSYAEAKTQTIQKASYMGNHLTSILERNSQCWGAEIEDYLGKAKAQVL